ncbi:hypothetical protein DFQ05_0827 [Winogradskyella wandonensis]|uniref:Uncharacterized protein n=1 Tax=Winogradskyella wandonensis TaxID=1442586 RepID=A0A4R1KVT3_9FLAO|nr:hypothetical protein [Winogradskyella wandonensis]TCK69306.1 hypothetical protein DFQ05_0827 [Winogradskyella wandonensis]
MENLIEVKNDYNTLDKLHNRLKKEANYDCSKTYDSWEVRTDANGQMAQCLVLKKSGMHAVKAYFINDNTIKINYIIPNKVLHAYFGKSVKARRNILEIATGVIKEAVLAGSQKKAFDELQTTIKRATA